LKVRTPREQDQRQRDLAHDERVARDTLAG
jgi:hypothetical protein